MKNLIHTLDFNGIYQVVILHEYDHIQGVLFTDKISKFKRTLIQKKLNKIFVDKLMLIIL